MVSQYSKDYNRLLEAALNYARMGWHILPLQDGSKIPRLKEWQRKATTEEATIRQWWKQWPNANLGLGCGPETGILALDIDGEEGARELARLEDELGKLPTTPTSKTPNKGMHKLFLWPSACEGQITNRVKMGKRPIDIRGQNAQIVLPPSMLLDPGQIATDVCASYTAYSWGIAPNGVEDAPGAKGYADPADLPERWIKWLLGDGGDSASSKPAPPTPAPTTSAEPTILQFTVGATGRPNAESRAITYLSKSPPAISGQGGHATTLTVARAIVHGFDLGAERGFDLLMQHWNPTCQPPWTEAELRRKCAEADRLPFDKPRGWLLAEDRGGGATPTATPTPTPSATVGQEEDIESIALPDAPPWPVLRQEAYHGIAGEIVQAIAPHSEADPVAILGQLLVAFGNAVGRRPYFPVEGSKHHANLFLAVVGKSSKARKGTSWGRVSQIMKDVDPDWLTERIFSGLSSGEGLIHSVRDPRTRVNEDGELETTEEGVDDKRCLALESEFGQVLQQLKRQGNTLSAIIRQAWDSGNLQTMTRANALRATDAHISIIGHITIRELQALLGEVDLFNGFANRFLWLLARRPRLLPEGSEGLDLSPFTDRLQRVLKTARSIGEMTRDQQARELWREAYAGLNEEREGLYDAVTSRGSAQVVRLSVLYALLDASPIIKLPHLQAALALWDYADESARVIFGAAPEDPLPAQVLKKLTEAGAVGMTRTQLHHAFARYLPGKQLVDALAKLRDQGKVTAKAEATTGRPRERWFALRTGEVSEVSRGTRMPIPDNADLTSLNTLNPFFASLIRNADGTEEVTI